MGAEGTSGPVLLVVAGEDQLTPLARALEHRFDRDYRVLREGSADAGLATLQRLAAAGEEIALVLVAEQLGGRSGYDVLAEAQARHPAARRAVIARYADLTTNVELNRAMALSRLDSFVMERWDPPEEGLYRPLGELLAEWTSATRRPRFEAVRVVGDRWDPRSHALRDNLERNGLPAASTRRIRRGPGAAAPRRGWRRPGCRCSLLFDGRVLVHPSFADIADAFGIRTRARTRALRRRRRRRRPGRPGGRGVRRVGGAAHARGRARGDRRAGRHELADPQLPRLPARRQRGRARAARVPAGMVLRRRASPHAGRDRHRGRGRPRCPASPTGRRSRARAVVLATGVATGASVFRRWRGSPGRGVFYGAAVVRGAGDAPASGRSWWAAATRPGRPPCTSPTTHACHGRRPRRGLAEPCRTTSSARSRRRRTSTCAPAPEPARRRRRRLPRAPRHQRPRLGEEQRHDAGGLFLLIGAEPHTAWLPSVIERDGGGYVLTGRDLVRDGAPPSGWSPARPPGLLETSIPGIFVAGDVRHGSIKRVAAAVGEGSTAIQLVHQHLAAEAPEAARAR